MKKIFNLIFILLAVLLINGCGTSNLEIINYNELEQLLKNKETFILEIVQDGCSNCEMFSPKFDKILKKHNIKSKQLNLTNLTEEDSNNFKNLYNVDGTPAVLFINEGEETSISRRIIGNVDEDKIISKLKIAGYIK